MKPTESNALDSKRIPEWIILYSFFRASQNKELRPATKRADLVFPGSSDRIRTGDLRLERASERQMSNSG